MSGLGGRGREAPDRPRSAIDRILDLLDTGLQRASQAPGRTDGRPDQCARCQTHRPAPDGELCSGCRAFLLGDTEKDPVQRQDPAGLACTSQDGDIVEWRLPLVDLTLDDLQALYHQEAVVDQLLNRWRERFIVEHDATYAFDAGLADAHARAGLPRQHGMERADSEARPAPAM